MTSGLEKERQTGLVRAIGRWGLVGLTMNIIIGAGIFGLPSRIFGLAKGWSIVAYLVCAVIRLLAYVATCVALPILRLKSDAPLSRFSVPGGAAVSLIATVLSLWLLSSSSARDATAAGLSAVLGLVIYVAMTVTRQRRTNEILC